MVQFKCPRDAEQRFILYFGSHKVAIHTLCLVNILSTQTDRGMKISFTKSQNRPRLLIKPVTD